MAVFVHKDDLPEVIDFGASVAVDTEALGLRYHRDRLCVVQLSGGDGDAHLVQFQKNYGAPNLKQVLENEDIMKIFHFARFDLGIIRYYLGVWAYPCYCTKIASRLVRTYTENHGLRDLCYELLGVKLNKAQQGSDWGREDLLQEQRYYAASDVLYLHTLKEKLDFMLKREGRMELAESCFNFLFTRVELDLMGWELTDLFAH